MRNAPKMKNTQANRLIAAAPSAMKMPRKIERQDDADQQRELLQLSGHLQLAHDDDEDEQVVDRQAVLGQPAGEELARILAARKRPRPRGRTAWPAPTKMPMKMPASFIDGSCGRRPMMNTSIARMATITTTVMTQA